VDFDKCNVYSAGQQVKTCCLPPRKLRKNVFLVYEKNTGEEKISTGIMQEMLLKYF
jgi:hypothetical protein